MIKYLGTAEQLLISSSSVSLICVKFIRQYADMAELADAYGSGPYVRKDMQVQVLLSAPVQSLCTQLRWCSQARILFTEDLIHFAYVAVNIFVQLMQQKPLTNNLTSHLM